MLCRVKRAEHAKYFAHETNAAWGHGKLTMHQQPEVFQFSAPQAVRTEWTLGCKRGCPLVQAGARSSEPSWCPTQLQLGRSRCIGRRKPERQKHSSSFKPGRTYRAAKKKGWDARSRWPRVPRPPDGSPGRDGRHVPLAPGEGV